MTKIISLFNIELLKLKHQRFPLFSLIFAISLTIAAAVFRDKLSDVGTFGMGQANGWQILSFAASWGVQVSAIIILILSINLVAEEFSDRTIKNLLTRPINRAQFFGGKILTIVFIVLIFLLFILITSIILGSSLGDMGHLQERGYIIVKWQTILWNLIIAFLLSLITLSAVGIFGSFISILIPKTGVAIGFSICLYFVLHLAAQFDNVKYFLFTHFTSLPINTFKEVTYGLASKWTPQIYWCLLTTLVSIAVFIFLAILILNRKDILS